MPALPEPLSGHASVYSGGKLHVFGGSNWFGRYASWYGNSEATSFEYDFESARWREVAAPTSGFALGAVESSSGILGVFASDYGLVWASKYETSGPAWQDRAQLAEDGHSYGGCDVLGDTLYGVFSRNRLYAYDLLSDEWRLESTLAVGEVAGVAAVSGKLWIISAETTSGGYPAVGAYKYDPESKTLSACLGYAPARRTAFEVGHLGEKVLVVGGTSYTGQVSTVESFDTSNSAWSAVAPLLTPRSYVFSVASAPNAIYALGGGYTSYRNGSYNNTILTSVERLDLGSVVPDAPRTTFSVDPVSPDGLNGFYRTAPSIVLTRDRPGVTYYQWDSVSEGSWSAYSVPLAAPTGRHTLYAYSEDTGGIAEQPTGQVFWVDNVMPSASILSPANGASVRELVPVSIYATDNESNATFDSYRTEYGVGTDPSAWSPLAEYTASDFGSSAGGGTWNSNAVPNGPAVIRLTVRDKAGNSTVRTVTVNVGNQHGQAWQTITPADVGWLSHVSMSPDFANDGVLLLDNQRSQSPYDHRVVRTTNRGLSWSTVATLSGVNINGIKLSRTFAIDDTILIETSDGLRQSSDRGETWRTCLAGYIYSASLSPNYSLDRRVVAVTGAGAFRTSLDGGDSWTTVVPTADGEPLTGNYMGPVAMSPAFAQDHTLFSSYGSGDSHWLLKSTDGGSDWHKIALPDSRVIRGVVLSPDFASDRTLVVETDSTWSSSGGFVGYGGLYMSTDAGLTFSRLTGWNVSGAPAWFSPDYQQDGTLLGNLNWMASARYAGSPGQWYALPQKGLPALMTGGGYDACVDGAEYWLARTTQAGWSNQSAYSLHLLHWAPATDTVPPSAAVSLVATSLASTQAELRWVAPGDDGQVGAAAVYDVRYSTSPITQASWEGAQLVAGEPVPAGPGTAESMLVTGLAPGTTLYFALRTGDEEGNWSDVSNSALLEVQGPSPDASPPAVVSSLAVGTRTTSSVQLTWTSPGDDGTTGQAATYDIRYSTSPITDGNWSSATQTSGEPSPKSAGQAESFTVPGLSPDTLYYFALKTADEVPNWSGLSSVVSGRTQASAPDPDTTPPTAPSNLSAIAGSCTAIHLSWTASTDNIGVTGYAVYDASNDATVAQPAGTSCTVSVLSPDTTYTYYVKAGDAAGNRSAASASASARTYKTPTGNTSTGTTVTVGCGNGATLVFDNVTGAGNTVVTRSTQESHGAPSGYRFRNYHYDISFTGSYSGTILVTLPYEPAELSGNPQNLKLFHWQDGHWEDVTVSVDTVNHTITGRVTSLSPFEMGEPWGGGPATGANTWALLAVALGMMAIGAWMGLGAARRAQFYGC